MTNTENSNGNRWPDPFSIPTKRSEYLERLRYGVSFFHKNKAKIEKIDKMKRKFIGEANKEDEAYIKRVFVRKARVQYYDYRLGHRIIMQLAGEWLRRPINSTIYAVNSGSISTTADAAAIHIGLHYAKQEVAEMREGNYGDPFDGMESAYDGENQENLFQKLNSKQSRTLAMQFILNDYIKKGGARDVLYSNYLDVIIGSSCFTCTTIGHNGKVYNRPVDNRRMAFMEIEGEYDIEQSPLIVEQRPMTLAQIIEEYPELLDDDRKTDLRKVRAWMGVANQGEIPAIDGSNFELGPDGNNMLIAYILQFKLNDPRAQKLEYKQEREIVADFSPEYYLENKDKIIKESNNGKFKVDVRYKKMVYQAVILGPDVIVGAGKVKNQINNPHDPFYAHYDYTGLLFNTVAGKRTSIQELIIKLEEEYNVDRMMFNREIAKFKGSIVGYNRAFLPRVNGQPVSKEEILATAINDGLMDHNTAADGNYSGETLDPKNLFSRIDLGISESLDILVKHMYDIENIISRIVGFNPERLGDTPASSTVTNATNNLINSQSATAPIDYFFDRHTDKVLNKYIEKKKISLAKYQKHEGNELLGSEIMAMIQEDDDFFDDFYGVYTSDSRREDAIRNRMSQRGEAAAANGEIRLNDLMKAEVAETIQEAAVILERGYEIQENNRRRIEEEKNKTMQAMNERNIQAMEEKDKRDKEHDVGATIVKGAMAKKESAQQAVADYALAASQNQNKLDVQKQKNLDNQGI